MKTLAGLWIDHREAIIVLVSEKGQEAMRIRFNAEKQLRDSGPDHSPSQVPFDSQVVPPGNSRERECTAAKYYDEIISCLRPAEAIMVFGPGEAKGELAKRIERNKLALRITRFETSDKMTERQVSQKVRRHYFPRAFPVSPGGSRRR